MRADRTAAEEVAASGRRGLGVEAHVVLCDLADPATHERAGRAAWNWRGPVDIWVNNAGADVLTGDAARWSFERKLDELWRVDVAATMRLSRRPAQRMKERGAGAIINIGWDQAERGMAGDSGELFAATKGAVMAFTKSLARSLAPEVRVNCVAPGWIKTAWGAGASQLLARARPRRVAAGPLGNARGRGRRGALSGLAGRRRSSPRRRSPSTAD